MNNNGILLMTVTEKMTTMPVKNQKQNKTKM